MVRSSVLQSKLSGLGSPPDQSASTRTVVIPIHFICCTCCNCTLESSPSRSGAENPIRLESDGGVVLAPTVGDAESDGDTEGDGESDGDGDAESVGVGDGDAESDGGSRKGGEEGDEGGVGD